MSAIVVDTSVWVDFFRGRALPALEDALRSGDVLLSPIVAAELLSARMTSRQQRDLANLIQDLPLHQTALDHWMRVGTLRASAAERGITISVPDAEIAQCAIDTGGHVWSLDRVFEALARVFPLKLFSASSTSR